jgi:hypothetical protein
MAETVWKRNFSVCDSRLCCSDANDRSLSGLSGVIALEGDLAPTP